MRLSAVAVLAGLIAAPALAAPPPTDIPNLPPKTVAPVTVAPATTDPPKIVASFPAQGEVIAPGALVLHITFDQKMDDDGFSFAPVSGTGTGGRMPDCLKTPRLLNDEKTFVLLCTTAPKTSYALAFNAAPHGGFANIGGKRAVPAQLAFSTNDDDGPRDLDDALKIAKLTRADVPIATQP